VIAFDDLVLGPQRQNPAEQCGDLLLKDRRYNFTYQLAVVVDDIKQGVNLVIRGQDLTASTGRQIWLGRRLGREVDARFAHHPLLVDETGRKLGKRFLSAALTQRRLAGERAEDVLGEAAYLGGLVQERRAVEVGELAGLFP
jgi:glutamyl-tRNA synthetase/glutamyl-Q tRNA(Asp) synthetase